ncbi:MAG: hypothetical protein RIT03_1376 [Bacteroidota bacterium]|jgi:hypothetical protein
MNRFFLFKNEIDIVVLFFFSLVNLNPIPVLCAVHTRIDCYHESWRE